MTYSDPFKVIEVLAYEDPYSEKEDYIPDPEGYFVGQEGQDDDDDSKHPEYDDGYEPDVDYDGF